MITEPTLKFCEGWLGSLPLASGDVPVARAMTYDLVQLLNQADASNYGGKRG